MAQGLVTKQHLQDIADAIRRKTDEAGSAGALPLITKEVTQNGTYRASDDDAFGYSHITVNVEATQAVLVNKTITENGTYNPSSDNADGYSQVMVSVDGGTELTAADEGKVVVEDSGSYVLAVQTSLSISQNGTYDTTTNDEVVVSVSGGGGGSATLVPKTITENGTYDPADDEADGYSEVTVNVSGGGEAEPTLPAEYQEVEYVEFDGNSYVPISGRIIAILSSYECWAERTTESTSEMAALGTSNGSYARFELYFSNGAASSYCNNIGDHILSANDVFTFSANKVSAQNVGVNQKSHLAAIITNQTTTSDYGTNYIVIGRHDTSYRLTGRVYKVRIGSVSLDFTSGDTPAAGIIISTLTWLKPCYRKSDDVVGFYDTEADVFYTNSGSGTLTAGPDV